MRVSPTPLRELALLFLRLGATAFGGPAAHIGMLRHEVVTRRQWLSDEAFLDLLGATNLIPGPNSTEMAIHIGWQRRRFAGLVVAGACFIAPAMALTALLAHVYVRYGSLPAFRGPLYGIKPVILAIVLQAILGLAPRAMKTRRLALLAIGSALLAALGVNELGVLFGAGALNLVFERVTRRDLAALVPFFPVAATAGTAGAVSLPSLFWVFLKTGSVLFGSGYVLLAFLRADLVQRLGWLSEGQLIDAIAAGQITPGPVFSSATFIGWLLAGPKGALLATLGIFLPAFVFVAASGPLVPKLRASRSAAALLDGVNAASLALMAIVTLELGRAALVDAWTLGLGLVSALLLLRFRPSSTWLVLAAGVVGWVVQAR